MAQRHTFTETVTEAWLAGVAFDDVDAVILTAESVNEFSADYDLPADVIRAELAHCLSSNRYAGVE